MQYYDENALLIDDRRQIAKHYMSSWFFLDLATSTPVDQIICALGFEKNIDGQIVRRFLRVCVCVCVCACVEENSCCGLQEFACSGKDALL